MEGTELKAISKEGRQIVFSDGGSLDGVRVLKFKKMKSNKENRLMYRRGLFSRSIFLFSYQHKRRLPLIPLRTLHVAENS